MLHYSGAGAQTITPNVSIASIPIASLPSVTAAIRFTYTGSASNPGLNILSPVAASTTYTMSAWVYIESLTSTPGNGGFAENGVISGTSVDIALVGQWQKITWTRTTTASPGPNFGLRFASMAGTGTGSILVTGITIEVSDATGASPIFFDGATSAGGDFTYAWTGTANNSSSIQKATENAGWSPITNSIEYWSTQSPMHGTHCAGVITKGASGDGITCSDSVVAAFTTYTMSIYIKLTAAVPNFTIQMRWKDNVGAIISDTNASVAGSLTVGQWSRVSVTATSPSGATSMQPIARILAVHSSTLFYVDSLMVEQATFLSPYFDGSTAAAGDFTYAWTGTANQTASEERAPTVSGWTGLYTGGRVAYQSSAWNGSGAKCMAISGNRPTVDSFSMTNTPPIAGNLGGRTFTFLANLKTMEAYPAGADGRAWGINVVVNLSGGGQFQYNLKPTTTYLGIHEIKQTITIRSDATTMAYLRLYNGSPNDVPIYWDNFMIVEGTYVGDYIDGTKPFSKWDGAANASTSVGYPPQFLDIAGKPTLDLLGAANTGALAVSPYIPRTFYLVHEHTGNTSAFTSTFLYGTIPNNGFNNQTAAAGSNSIINRLDFVNGDFNKAIIMGNGRTTKRHVSAYSFNQGLTSVSACVDGGSDIVTALNPGDGWADGRVITTSAGENKNIRALVFYAEHDRSTRIAMCRYLGNKYGAYVA